MFTLNVWQGHYYTFKQHQVGRRWLFFILRDKQRQMQRETPKETYRERETERNRASERPKERLEEGVLKRYTFTEVHASPENCFYVIY